MDDERPLDWADEEEEDDFRDFGANMGKLLDLIAASQPRQAKTFLDRLTPQVRDELLSLRQQYHAGELGTKNCADVYRAIRAHLAGVSDTTFRRWFNKGADHAENVARPVAKQKGSKRREGKAKAPRGAS